MAKANWPTFATLKGTAPAITGSNNVAIEANNTLVARKGQPLDGKTVKTFEVSKKVAYSGAQRRSINNNGQIIAKVTVP